MSVDLHNRVLSGNEFQTDGAATEKARRAVSVLVLGTSSQLHNKLKTAAFAKDQRWDFRDIDQKSLLFFKLRLPVVDEMRKQK